MAKKNQPLTPEVKLAQALVPKDQQPYELPQGWVWTRLECINSFKNKSLTPNQFPEEVFEMYSVPSFSVNYPEIVNGEKIGSSKQLVEKDDVLLCKINPRINRVWKVYQYTEHQQLASSEWIVVRNHAILSDYLMWYFRCSYFREYMLSNVSGVGGSLMRAQPKFVKTYPVPLPPLPEQQRIVARIESLFVKLDAAQEKLQTVLDSQEARRAAILHEAFTGRLTGKRSEECRGKSEEGDSQNISLKECGTWHGGGTPSKSHEEYWENGDIMWITSKDMKSNLIDTSMVCINQKGVENSSAIYCEKPSVLFVMRSGILRHSFPVAVVRKPYTVNQDLKALVPNPDLIPEYIFWACKENEQNILHQCMKSGTTVESINFQALQQFQIPYFPQSIQKQIVDKIHTLMKQEDSVAAITQSTLSQIDLLKKSILARAFRGQLGTQDPSDPDARELLL